MLTRGLGLDASWIGRRDERARAEVLTSEAAVGAESSEHKLLDQYVWSLTHPMSHECWDIVDAQRINSSIREQSRLFHSWAPCEHDLSQSMSLLDD